jgi:hypothetical protein
VPVGPCAKHATPRRVGKRVETAIGRFEPELRVAVEKCVNHVVGFLGFKAAGAVNEQAIRGDRTARPVEELPLNRRSAPDIFGTPSPLDFGASANGSETSTWRVEEDAREPATPISTCIQRIVKRRLNPGKA